MGSYRTDIMTKPGLQPNVVTNGKMYRIKVVLVGDINVGKTSLAHRFSQDKFDGNYKHTIGASFIAKTAIVGDCVINFQIWDTAGQERYRSLVPMYLRGAHIAFIVYDVTDAESYGSIGFWLDALHHHCDMVQPVLVANKCDLEPSKDHAIAEIFAEEQNLTFFAVSAKTGYNVDKLFHTMGAMVVNQFTRERQGTLTSERPITILDTIEIEPATENDREKNTKKSRRRCCKT